MKPIITIILSLFINISFSQEIIGFKAISNGIIQLGEKANIQFNINQKAICDSYTVNWNIDYRTKSINIDVNYNYISSCNNSFSVFSEFQQKQLTLTGIYSVNLKLNVPANPLWNRLFALGPISVIAPVTTSCSSFSIPFLEELCPLSSNMVCACDGTTYSNECEAYLKERNGSFEFKTCPQYIQENEKTYMCNRFTSQVNKNFFEKYGCESGAYPGNEIILKYEHLQTDSVSIAFMSSTNDVTLFLIKLENNKLNCIHSSTGQRLVYPNLPAGTYYLIADRSRTSSFEITFCEPIVSANEFHRGISHIFPNPAGPYINIVSSDKSIKEIELYNIQGALAIKNSYDNAIPQLETGDLNGLHFLKIKYRNGAQEVIKVLIQN